jgi:hypothetical protein
MIAIVLIAMAAGCASALMYASMISGALISVVLIYLAPLPLMVAAIGWGPPSATIGGVGAAVGLGAIIGLPHCIAFVVMVALPAWWLGHLVLLGRPGTNGTSSSDDVSPTPPDLEWYPIGSILLWLSGFATLTTMATLLSLGTDFTSVTNALRQGWLLILNRPDAAATGENKQLVDALVTITPAAAAMGFTIMLTLNLWLAAKITRTSGRLQRPWPDLKSTALPSMTLVLLFVAIALCFMGGLLAILALIVATVLVIAYALTGFAVLHTLTLALKNRALWLSCAYTVVFVFSWPVLVIAALGIADAVFGIRQRYLQGRPPPVPTP